MKNVKKVLVIGSVNMDYTVYVDSFPNLGETIYGKSRFIQPGGKGENQAIALAKSNKVETHFIASIGKDNDGKAIKELLDSYNLYPYLKECDEVETGNATIFVDDNSENKIVIIEGANGELKPEDISEALVQSVDYVLLQNEIPQITNHSAILLAHKLGKTVIYNPAPFRKINEVLLPFIDYLIPNEGELFKLTGIEDPILGAKSLIDKGVKNVLVTLGTKGSILVNKDEVIKVDAYKVEAVDTVAAGDTYVGYFLASIASGLSTKEAMEKASLASSIAVTRKGSVISIPTGEEVYD